jgi:hypothetical protein
VKTILDNFLEQENFIKLKNKVCSSYFPWFFNESVLDDNSNSIFDYQFIHFVIKNNQITTEDKIFEVFKPLIKKLNSKSIIRLKLNLNTATHIHYDNGLHTDVSETNNVKTAIFYINTNNGSTLFEDGSKVDCIENRILIFDSNNKHQARTSTDTKARYVANINFLPA